MSQPKHLNLMLGGPHAEYPPQWQRLPGSWAGVDRGTLTLLAAGVVPEFAVWDFDSLSTSEWQAVQEAVPAIHPALPEKDETDSELALHLAFTTYQAASVTLVGATGGRLDHLLANFFLPTQPRFLPYTDRLTLLDAQNRVTFHTPGRYTLTRPPEYRYFGVVPLTAVSGLTITGAKYPLQEWHSQTPFSWASNEFVGDAPITVSWRHGVIALIDSRDRNGQQQDN